jgi:cell division septum initiation protein DivIVA
MENLDPNATPGEPGTDPGQPAEQVQQPAPVDPVAAKLAQLEEQNKALQGKLTQYGRKLKTYETTQTSPQQAQPAEDFDWANPGASIGKYVGKALTEFEARQEQRRAAEDLIRRTAEQNGIPVPQLQEYYSRLQEAASDPDELMGTIARMYRADHAEEAISEAKRMTQQTVERNARGVTSAGGATHAIPSAKDPKDMNDKELDEHVMRVYGKAEWPT